MARFLDWFRGLRGEPTQKQIEASAELTRQRQTDAINELGLTTGFRQASPQPEPIRRAENEVRPAERLLPHEGDRLREVGDRGPQPERKPDQVQEATKMAYTITPQPGPSIGGPGKIWIPPKVPKPAAAKDYWADEIELGTKVLAEKKANLTPEHELDHEVQAVINELINGRDGHSR